MPSFLKDLQLRRKSRASVKTDNSNSSSSNGSNDGAADEVPQNKSSSTLSSFFNGSTTPPTSFPAASKSWSNSTLNGAGGGQSPPSLSRPRLPSAHSNRYSIVGMPSTSSPPPRTLPADPLAPRVLSISDSSWVHQKILLISGEVGEPQMPVNGEVVVYHDKESFPPTSWPVSENHFKALVHLQPGPNRLRLDFYPQRKPSQPQRPYSSNININYLPMTSSPPLHLAILVAKDSPRTFDAVPERVKSEGHNLDTAIRKFKMAAYLWQAFTGEQMNRHGFGRRCFRFEEEWQTGTLSNRDFETNQLRNEAKINVIVLDKTVDELRELDFAQQYEPAQRKGELFSIAIDACKKHFGPRPGQKHYVSCMFLDTHWDKEAGTVRGHAALGGGVDDVKLAIFGSHALQSYPAHLEEVVPAFTDCTRTDTNYVANDCNESGSNWEAANIGIGAHMHETGHLFGCPHQESGVMLRDYVRLNRTFTTREPYSTRTRSAGQLVLETDECAWHVLDALRFRFHPCFAIPNDLCVPADDSLQVWPIDSGSVTITSTSAIAWIEIYVEGDDLCHHWINHTNGPRGMEKQITLTEQELRERVGAENKNKKLKLKMFSAGLAEREIDDFASFTNTKNSRLKLPDGRVALKGAKLGFSQMEGSRPQELILQAAHMQTKLLRAVRVYHGFALDGIEFCYEDGETQLFGKRGGKEGGDLFQLDTVRAETITGFYLRAGFWIDGIQIMTSRGRKSPIYGNKDGGSGHLLMPPRGYSIAGIYGSCGAWMDGFGLIITR